MPRIGLQLIVFGERARQNPEAVFQTAKAAGYEAVEFGYRFAAWEADDLRRSLEALGLSTAGVHAGFDILRVSHEAVAEYALSLGSENVMVSGVGDRSRGKAAYVEAAEVLNRIGSAYQGRGLTLAYHNHSFEFEVLEGRRGIDWLYEGLDGGPVRLCVDTYWVKHGGEDPVEWIRRFGDRTAVLHLKDMGTDEQRSFVEIGQGIIDFRGVLGEASARGIEWWVVEQDRSSRLPEESCRMSRRALQELGY